MNEQREMGETSGNAEHDARRHRKKSPWRRVRHAFRRLTRARKWLFPASLVVVLILCASALWLTGNLRRMEAGRVTAANPHAVGSGYRNITYKGREYRYNSRITAVLLVGLDSEGDMEPNETFISAPNADSLSLVVLDGYHKKMTIMAINRNTICKFHRYSLHGYDMGEFSDPVCLAYAYGENGEVSCRNLMNAVSGILYGIPIHDYIVTNRASLPLLARELGDVTVTVPNDDLLDYGYAKGDPIVVNADNIEMFVRKRDTDQRGSSILRMERQKAFINATVGRIVEMLDGDPTGVWKKIEAAEDYVRTSVTRSQYLDLCRQISAVSYDAQDYYSPEGVNKSGALWAEFYPDEEKLLEKIVDVFYLPA